MEICMMRRPFRSGGADILGDMYDEEAASIAVAAFPFQIYMVIRRAKFSQVDTNPLALQAA
ncbi:hypothetical protein FZC79_20665 [Rossellomorea vietnamensis]|uniref:Uncharacterized protein n=1 Tax=Rossellomorea vietnamensis TaxID=218284 RepID=A0A5D4K7I9_9BACI|nr:hypothetical protein [Rossellomorea vietnamensis]TYR72996.1 hypothetical protein FZC79_20665 [Rossellomorea vietnamensis]